MIPCDAAFAAENGFVEVPLRCTVNSADLQCSVTAANGVTYNKVQIPPGSAVQGAYAVGIGSSVNGVLLTLTASAP